MARRTNWIIGGAAVAAAVATVAIGVVGNDGGRSTSAPAGLQLDDLEPALLTVEDVGEGFGVAPPDDDNDSVQEEEGYDMSPECRETLDRFEETEDTGDSLQADFEHEDDRGTVTHELELIEADDPTLSDVARAFEGCETLTYDDPEEGTTTELALAVEEVDGIGDESLGLRFDATISEPQSGFEIDLHGYGIMFERGGVVSSVMEFAGFDSSTLVSEEVDRARVKELAESVDSDLRQILGE